VAKGWCSKHWQRMHFHGSLLRNKKAGRKGFIKGGVGYIPLTKGLFAKCSPDDLELLTEHNWCAKKIKKVYRAMRATELNGEHLTIQMTEAVLGKSRGRIIDHKNRDTLDNRRSNLRFCTYSQNSYNKASQKGSKSRYKGVHWNGKYQEWHVKLYSKSVYYGGGRFKDEHKAALAYNVIAKEVHGDFAYLNLVV